MSGSSCYKEIIPMLLSHVRWGLLIHRFLLHVLEAGDFFEKMGRAHGKTMKGMNFMEFICDSKYIILPVSFL